MLCQNVSELKEVEQDYRYQPPKEYQTDYLPIKKHRKNGAIK